MALPKTVGESLADHLFALRRECQKILIDSVKISVSEDKRTIEALLSKERMEEVEAKLKALPALPDAPKSVHELNEIFDELEQVVAVRTDYSDSGVDPKTDMDNEARAVAHLNSAATMRRSFNQINYYFPPASARKFNALMDVAEKISQSDVPLTKETVQKFIAEKLQNQKRQTD